MGWRQRVLLTSGALALIGVFHLIHGRSVVLATLMIAVGCGVALVAAYWNRSSGSGTKP